MKNTFLTFILILTTTFLSAQELQFAPFTGYTFADQFKIDRGTAEIGGGMTYGGNISYVFDNKWAIELSYSWQKSIVSAYSEYHEINVRGPIRAKYAYLGGSKLFALNEEVFLFTGINAGLGIYSEQDNRLTSSTKFALGFNGGIKYFFYDRVGLRFQANLNVPVSNIGEGFWWESDGEAPVELNSRTPFVQFALTGGLIVILN